MPVQGTYPYEPGDKPNAELKSGLNELTAISHGYRAHYYISTPLLDRILAHFDGKNQPQSEVHPHITEIDPIEYRLSIELRREMRRNHGLKTDAGVLVNESPEKQAATTTAEQRTYNQQLWDEMEARDEELLRKLAGETGEEAAADAPVLRAIEPGPDSNEPQS